MTSTPSPKNNQLISNPLLRGCLGSMSFFASGVSLALLTVGFSKGFESPGSIGASIICIFGALVFAYGAYKAFKKPKGNAEKIQQNGERICLSLAQKKAGFLSIAELSLEGNLSIEKAEKILNAMVLSNIARSEVSGSGNLVYVFESFKGKEGQRKDTLEIAIENAYKVTDDIKLDLKKKAEAEEVAHVEAQVWTDSEGL